MTKSPCPCISKCVRLRIRTNASPVSLAAGGWGGGAQPAGTGRQEAWNRKREGPRRTGGGGGGPNSDPPVLRPPGFPATRPRPPLAPLPPPAPLPTDLASQQIMELEYSFTYLQDAQRACLPVTPHLRQASEQHNPTFKLPTPASKLPIFEPGFRSPNLLITVQIFQSSDPTFHSSLP